MSGAFLTFFFELLICNDDYMYERWTKTKEMKNFGSTTYWNTTRQAIPFLCFIAFHSRRVTMISVHILPNSHIYANKTHTLPIETKFQLLLVAVGARRMRKVKNVCVFQWNRYGWLCVCVRAQRKMKLSGLRRFEEEKKITRRRWQRKSVHDIFPKLRVYLYVVDDW